MQKQDKQALRAAVCKTARTMSNAGLSPGKSGNVSQRIDGGFLITPSGMSYDTLEPDHIVEVAMNGEVTGEQLKPSSETPLHRTIYLARPEVRAIVHCHSPSATALACTRRNIPAFHYMVAVAGGNQIPLADYATFGTDDLAHATLDALNGHKACLMANHGQITLGSDLKMALELAMEVENLARQYLDVLATGTPHILDDDEMTRVLEKFADYGKQPDMQGDKFNG